MLTRIVFISRSSVCERAQNYHIMNFCLNWQKDVHVATFRRLQLSASENEGAIMLHDIESRVIILKNVDLSNERTGSINTYQREVTLRNEKELHCSLCWMASAKMIVMMAQTTKFIVFCYFHTTLLPTLASDEKNTYLCENKRAVRQKQENSVRIQIALALLLVGSKRILMGGKEVKRVIYFLVVVFLHRRAKYSLLRSDENMNKSIYFCCWW